MIRRLLFCTALLLLSTTIPITAQVNGIPDDLPPITAANATLIEPLFALDTPLEGIFTIDWSPDGRFIVVTGIGGMYLYNAADLNRFARVQDRRFILNGSSAFSPDGRILVSGGLDYLRVWDLTTGDEINRFPTAYPVGAMRFSPDGTILAVGADGEAFIDGPINRGTVYLWDIATGQEFGIVGYPYSALGRTDVVEFRFAFDALWTVSGLSVHEWDPRQPDLARDPLLLTRDTYLDRLSAVTFVAPDSPIYAWTPFRDADGLYALWLENDDETLFITQNGDTQPVTAGDIPAQLGDFAQLDRTERAQSLGVLGDLTFPLNGETLTIINRREVGVVSPRYEVEGDTLIDKLTDTIYTAVENGDAGRFESETGEPPPSLGVFYAVGETPPAVEVFSLDFTRTFFSEDGSVLAWGEDGGLVIQDLNSGVEQFIPFDSASVERVNFSDDNTLLTVNTGDTDFLIDVATGEVLFRFEESTQAVFSADRSVLVTHWLGRLTFWVISGQSM